MPSLSRLRTKARKPAVLSLMAIQREPTNVGSQFEVLVRHLYDRLLNNEVFGEDAAARLAELAYAIALPGVLVALFLFPAYHGLPPHPQERGYWSQACDHLFFVTYAFVIMGGAVIFQWEMLFPDALDISVMATLPIRLRRLLTGRIAAMTMFLGLVHVGTSGLGCLFLPAVADQRCGYFRQLLAQVVAVSMSGISIVGALITVQAVLVSLPGGTLADTMRAVVRILSLIALLTLLFLFPLTAHYLHPLLGASISPAAVRWFPPFWFLAIYECVMWSDRAPLIFHSLAPTGVLAAVAMMATAVATYPLGYQRRVRQILEGSMKQRDVKTRSSLQALLHRVVLRTPKTRATAHFVAQTLRRTERLQLYMAMYIGLGIALVLSGVLAPQLDGPNVKVVFSSAGLRMSVPVVAFWAVAGMKTVMLSPIGRRGSWIFRVIDGTPGNEVLRGGRVLTTCVAIAGTLLSIAALNALAPRNLIGIRMLVTQVLFGCTLPIILTEIFFADFRTVPFAGIERRSVHELPFTFVRYFVIFPAFVLTMAAAEDWTSLSVLNTSLGVIALGAASLMACSFRMWLIARLPPKEELTLIRFGAE